MNLLLCPEVAYPAHEEGDFTSAAGSVVPFTFFCRILNINPKKELLWSPLWVRYKLPNRSIPRTYVQFVVGTLPSKTNLGAGSCMFHRGDLSTAAFYVQARFQGLGSFRNPIGPKPQNALSPYKSCFKLA